MTAIDLCVIFVCVRCKTVEGELIPLGLVLERRRRIGRRRSQVAGDGRHVVMKACFLVLRIFCFERFYDEFENPRVLSSSLLLLNAGYLLMMILYFRNACNSCCLVV